MMNTNISYLCRDIGKIALDHEDFDEGCETHQERMLHQETILKLKELVANIEFYHWQFDPTREDL